MEVQVDSKQRIMIGDTVLHEGQEAVVACGPDRHDKFCIDVPVCGSFELRIVHKNELTFKCHDPYDTCDVDLPLKKSA